MATTLQEVRLRGVDTNGYLLWNLQPLTFFDCIIDIGITTLTKELPHCPIGLERLLVHLLGSIHQERQNGVSANILRNILLGVVSSHLSSIVDILLEDIS